MIVATLRVGMQPRTLCVRCGLRRPRPRARRDAERRRRGAHAERGSHQKLMSFAAEAAHTQWFVADRGSCRRCTKAPVGEDIDSRMIALTRYPTAEHEQAAASLKIKAPMAYTHHFPELLSSQSVQCGSLPQGIGAAWKLIDTCKLHSLTCSCDAASAAHALACETLTGAKQQIVPESNKACRIKSGHAHISPSVGF